MKNLLVVLILFFSWMNFVVADDQESCAKYASKANTRNAASYIYSACLRSDGFSKSKAFKCAIRSGKAKMRNAASWIYSACLRSDSYFKSKAFKCAIRSEKAKTSNAAYYLYSSCLKN